MRVYNQAFEREALKVVEAAGELHLRRTTHSWITKSGLNHDQRTKLMVATLGKFELDPLMH